ncbi:hypothetical protein HPB48_013448 [Haemaphysalis longicornis]|uniref:Uncharacterized protein n=3 Tax=Haemaphysalis longicornis TaxID=44386 RepID=A0A9J6GX00_HAELO|nr:hypothetical protein HPB48_013448 [Haemaphysalis longicornis]
MELEGLKRALKELTDHGVVVTEVVTDRHPQVRKYFRTEQPDVDHLFDAWHVAKGHHDGHSELYRTCQHGQLQPRKWIYPGTDAYDKLRSIVSTKRLLDDIRQVSPNFQTSGVESFHAIINRFAPKALSFSSAGMEARHPPAQILRLLIQMLLKTCSTVQATKYLRRPVLRAQTLGSLAIVRTMCHCGVKEWRSQPMQAKYAMGNVELAAAIVFTGCSPMQIIRFLQNAGICCFCERTFHRLQALYLLPAVDQVWKKQQVALLEAMKASGTGAKLAGDSRADSPGHCAKFGTYSLLDTTLNKIVDVKLVEAGGQVFLNRLTGASIQHAKSFDVYSCALSKH